MRPKTLDFIHARTLDVGNLLVYIVSIYGEEVYLKPQLLAGLLADLMNEEERVKRFYRRAIFDDQISKKIYLIAQHSGDYESNLDQLINIFVENNGYINELAENIVYDFLFGIKQNLVESGLLNHNTVSPERESFPKPNKKINFFLVLIIILFISLIIISITS